MPGLRLLAVLLLLLTLPTALAACGDEGDPEPTTVTLTSEQPASATEPASTEAATTEAATTEAEPTTAASPITGDSISPPASTDESDVPTTDVAETDVEPVGTGAADPAEQAIAEQAVLTADDLGAGWVGGLDEAQDTGCLTTPLRAPGPGAEVRGEQLTNGQQTAVRSIALVYPDAETAAQAFTLASDFAVIECFVENLKQNGPEGLVVDQVTAEPIQWPAAGDEVIAARVTLPVEQGLEGIVATADIVMTRAGRVIIVAQFLSAPEPFPKAQAAEVMTTAANSVAGA